MTNPGPYAAHQAGVVFVVGTVVTIATALTLLALGKPKTAAVVMVTSPFPCPPGMPC